MGRSAVEHPIGIPSAGFVNCSSNIHSAGGCEAPYRDETQVLANLPIFCMDSGKTGKIVESMRHPFRLCFSLNSHHQRLLCWGNQNGGKTSENFQESASRRIRSEEHTS